jgi:hypothetical protein
MKSGMRKSKREQALCVALRLAPEAIIDPDYGKWCEAVNQSRRCCHFRKGHSGPHMTGEGIQWDYFYKTVIPGPITKINFWPNNDKTEKSNRTRRKYS